MLIKKGDEERMKSTLIFLSFAASASFNERFLEVPVCVPYKILTDGVPSLSMDFEEVNFSSAIGRFVF